MWQHLSDTRSLGCSKDEYVALNMFFPSRVYDLNVENAKQKSLCLRIFDPTFE